MAAYNLLPGIAGSVTVTIPVGAVGTDTIDCSHCQGGLALVNDNPAAAAGGNFEVLHSFDGTRFPVKTANVAVTDDLVTLYDVTDGPFGILKFDGTDITTATMTVTVTGFAL